ncbi:hypothetical protein LEMLEM_LOCUS6683 [Lemmus lemmus]
MCVTLSRRDGKDDGGLSASVTISGDMEPERGHRHVHSCFS